MLGRDLISIADLSPDQLGQILELSAAMKRDGGVPMLHGQTIALVFDKPSLRTRVSFEMAMQRLGGHTLYLSDHEVHMGDREPVRDVARVLSRMVQGIAARTSGHERVSELAEWSDVPVINALSDDEHPCQALADLLTLKEHLGQLSGLRLSYLGEGNNVASSLAYASVLAGMDFVCASPPRYGLSGAVLERARGLLGGGSVRQVTDPREAVRGAAAIYTDVWASMGDEDKLESRIDVFDPFQFNLELMSEAPREALVMHDLPAHRGEEITDEVFESPRSVIFEQVENRMHTQQAVLALVLGGTSV